MRRQPPPPPPAPRHSGPRPTSAPVVVPASPSPSPQRSPEHLSSPSSIAFEDVFQASPPLPPPPPPQPAWRSSSSSARPPPQQLLQTGVRVHRSQSASRADIWRDILDRHQGAPPAVLLSLDFHKVCDREFWSTVRTFDLIEDQGIGLLILSYTTSERLRLVSEARSYISRVANSSRLQGPITLCVTPAKTGRTGKWRCLDWLVQGAPDQLQGVTHIDDNEAIIAEIAAKNSPGVQGRLYGVNNRWSLPEFLQYYHLL